MISPEENLRLREATAALCVFTLVQAMDHHKSKIYEPVANNNVEVDSAAASTTPKTFSKHAIPIVRLIIRICTQWPPSSSNTNNNNNAMSTNSLLEALSLRLTQNNPTTTSSTSTTTNNINTELFRETATVLETCLGVSRDSPRESIGSNVERALKDLSFFTQLCSGELLYNWVIKSLCEAEGDHHNNNAYVRNRSMSRSQSNNINNNNGNNNDTSVPSNTTVPRRTRVLPSPTQPASEDGAEEIINANRNDHNQNATIDSEDIGADGGLPMMNDETNQQRISVELSRGGSEENGNNNNNTNNSNDGAATARSNNTNNNNNTQQRSANQHVSQARLSILTQQQQLFVQNNGAYHFSEKSVGVVAPLALHLRSEWEKLAVLGLMTSTCASSSSSSGLGGEVVVALRLQKLASLPQFGWTLFVDHVFGNNNANSSNSSATSLNRQQHYSPSNISSTTQPQQKTKTVNIAFAAVGADGAVAPKLQNTASPTIAGALSKPTQHQSNSPTQKNPITSSSSSFPTSPALLAPSTTALLLHSTEQANLWRALHLLPTAAELDRSHSASTSFSIEALSAHSAGHRLGGGGLLGAAGFSSSAATSFLLHGGNVAERRRVHYHAALCALAKARKAMLRGDLSVARQCATVAASQHAPSCGGLAANTDILLASLSMKMYSEFLCGSSRDACQTIGVILDACVDSMRQSKLQSQGPPVLRPTNLSALAHLMLAVLAVCEALVFTPQAVDESLIRRLLFILSCLFTKEGIEASNWISASSALNNNNNNNSMMSGGGSSANNTQSTKSGGFLGGASDASDFVDPVLTRFVSETTSSISSPIILRLVWRRLMHYAEALKVYVFSNGHNTGLNYSTTNNNNNNNNINTSWSDPESNEFRMNEALLCLSLTGSSRFKNTQPADKVLTFLDQLNNTNTNQNNSILPLSLSSSASSSSSSPLSTFICRPQLATAILLNESRQHGPLSALRLFRYKLSNVLLVDHTMPRTWLTLQRTIILLCSSVLSDQGYSSAAASWIRSALASYAHDGTGRRQSCLHSSHDVLLGDEENGDNGAGGEDATTMAIVNNDGDTTLPLYLAPFLSTSASGLPLMSTLRAGGGDLPSLWGLETETLCGLCHNLAKIISFSLHVPEQLEALCLDPLKQHLLASSANDSNTSLGGAGAGAGAFTGLQSSPSSPSSSSSDSVDVAASVDHIKSLYFCCVGRPSLALSSLEQIATTYNALGFVGKAAEIIADAYVVAAGIHGDAESAKRFRILHYRQQEQISTKNSSSSSSMKLKGNPTVSFLAEISPKKMAEVLLASVLLNSMNCNSNEDGDDEAFEMFKEAKTCSSSTFKSAVQIIRSSVFGENSLFVAKSIPETKLSDKNIFKLEYNKFYSSSSCFNFNKNSNSKEQQNEETNNNKENENDRPFKTTTNSRNNKNNNNYDDESKSASDIEILPLSSSLSWLSLLLMSLKNGQTKNKMFQKIKSLLLREVFYFNSSSSMMNDSVPLPTICENDVNELEEHYYHQVLFQEVSSRRDARIVKRNVANGNSANSSSRRSNNNNSEGLSQEEKNLDSVLQSSMIDQVNSILDLSF